MNFAAFADTHIGVHYEHNGRGMADHLDSLAKDIMNNTVPCDFVLHLGDIVMHSTAVIEGENLPAHRDPYYNNFKAYMLQHINMPFIAAFGNHDLTDYYGDTHPEYPQNGKDPFNMIRKLIDAMEMNSPIYAFMKDNILFIVLSETDYHQYTKPIIYEYIEYMTRRYPDNTTIIFSHQAIEDTTIHDGDPKDTYRGKQDREWWAQLFRKNPQIKMWIHGHQHMLSWYKGSKSTGETYPVEDFGHEMAFSHPYSQWDWGDYHEEDRTVIYSVSRDGITTRTWENNGQGGKWVSGYDHKLEVKTSYDQSAQDWYSFAVFIQDGETQKTDMKLLSPNVKLELIGTQPMELFYDPTMATKGLDRWACENILGFGDDFFDKVTPNVPGMTVHGPTDFSFPPKYASSAKPQHIGDYRAVHEDGRTGQPYQFFPLGTTHAGVPGAKYEVTMIARSESGSGKINVEMSVSDWGTRSQYSTMEKSQQQIISHVFGTEDEKVTAVYTVPENKDAWFLQGKLDFPDKTDYHVSLFSIKRLQDSPTTDDFELLLNGKPYKKTGTLKQFEKEQFDVDLVTLADENGVIEVSSNIAGNHYGMARLIHYGPVLMGRNARFIVNNYNDTDFDITLQKDLSYFSDTYKMFPLSKKYGSLKVTSDDPNATVKTSNNSNQWIQSSTPAENKVKLKISIDEEN
ncbi:metallophosphoesterase [Candidatus Bathyarchaeota archaeon]|nr:metallophosphoesterase [Candidatus Bathyarchaeota archaeon]